MRSGYVECYEFWIDKNFYVMIKRGSCNNHPTIDFWLCRKGFGAITHTFGIPDKGEKFDELKDEWIDYFLYGEDMPIFLEELLDDNEYIETKPNCCGISWKIKKY